MAFLCINVLKQGRFRFLPINLSRRPQVCTQTGHPANEVNIARFQVSCHRTKSEAVRDFRHIVRSARAGAPPLLPRSFVKTPSSLQTAPVLKHCGHHFHTSAHLKGLPAAAVWMVLKPLQKLAAVILGRSIRKWWVALPANRRHFFREWVWQQRWHLATLAAVTMVIVSLLLLTHLDESPLTGRTRLLVFSRESYLELAALTAEAYMAEFAELLLPVTDVRHQVVERVVQHLAQRNKDIPEVSDVSWTVHVVEGPTVNAFVLPNGEVFVYTGMLENVADVHQLTIILGHEMAHAILGHSAEQASLSHILDLLSLVLLSAIWALCPRDSLALLGHWVQQKLSQLMFSRPYSRKLEAEADQVGLQLAAKACADVRAGPVFWQQMEIRDQLGGEASLPEWLSTHPSHRNRILQLDRLIPQALEMRESCACPALPATDPRAVFSKTVRMLLEKNEQEESRKAALTHGLPSVPAGLPAALLAPNALPTSSHVHQENKASA